MLRKLWSYLYHRGLHRKAKTAFGRVDIKKSWQQALKRAEISDCRAHDMRHTFATLAAGEGASNLELSCCMGHCALQMLLRYTHFDVKSTRKYSQSIAKKIMSETL